MRLIYSTKWLQTCNLSEGVVASILPFCTTQTMRVSALHQQACSLAPSTLTVSKNGQPSVGEIQERCPVRFEERSTRRATTTNDLKDVMQLPGPKILPVLGASLSVYMHPDYNPYNYHQFWNSMVSEYGPLFKIKLPTLPMAVCTSDADNVEIFMNSTLQNPHRTFFSSLKRVRYDTPGNPFQENTGLLTEYGDTWWRLRSKVQSTLMQPKNVQLHLPQLNSITSSFIDRIDELQEETGHVPDDFLEEIYKWALECIGTGALGTGFGSLSVHNSRDTGNHKLRLMNSIQRVLDSLNDTEMGIHIWKYFKTKLYKQLEKDHLEFYRAVGESTEKMIKKREVEKIEGKTLSPSVYDSLKSNTDLSEREIMVMIVDMFLAGMDTTSHVAAFALYLLAVNPDKQQKMMKEVDQVVGDSSCITADHITNTSYTAHVIRETLRMYPLTLGTGRMLKDDIVLSGYKIPAGTLAYSLNMQLSRNPKYFTQPDDFIPERWERSRPYGPIHPYSSLPFAHGKRICVGKRIAMQEIQTLLLKIIQKYEIILESKEKMKVKTHIVIKPDIPMPFKFVKRK